MTSQKSTTSLVPIQAAQSAQRLRTLVAQHAETARLMGVDFIPRYRAYEETVGEIAPKLPSNLAPDLAPDRAPDHASDSATEFSAAHSYGNALMPKLVPPVAASTAPIAASKAINPSKASTSKATTSLSSSVNVFVPSTVPAPAKKPIDRPAAQARLDALRAQYEADAPHKQFITSFNSIVFGDGDPCARLVFVGEAPGEEEDTTGIPFMGRSGQLLNKMITAMGTSRQEVYICNILKTRPPNNATPTSFESALCEPYLLEQLGIVHPEVIVPLGLPATHTLLKSTDSMAKLRANWASITLPNGLVVPVMPTYHPAYLLRAYTAENRRKVWSDLLQVAQKLCLAVATQSEGEIESSGESRLYPQS